LDWDSERLRRFLPEHVETFEELELRIVMSARPDEAVTEQEAATQIGCVVDEARDALRHLVERGFLVPDSGARGPPSRYAPSDPDLQLARSWSALAQLMSANAVERMRRNLQAFADAFFLGRKRNGG
jgi:hypothetical protein